jgi:magnesium chelatase family protein
VQKLKCATLDGLDVKVVEVESSFIRALPAFSIVGLASNSIQEAKERVKAALLANGFKFPPKKITINLSPSDLKKSGSHFDLAIALSIALEKRVEKDIYIFGELGLDGRIKDTNSIFPIVLALAKEPISILAPKEAAQKLSNIPNVTLYVVENLKEAIEFFNEPKEPFEGELLDYPSIKIDKDYYYLDSFELDFLDVKGQRVAKRAALIAAAGWHNILFEGTPGSGKSMISKRLRYILPPMSLEEILESAKLKALERKEIDFKPLRNFRMPHHSSTKASIFGGGSAYAKPGEVAFANKGILFFDEFPHFQKGVLEALREPLQERKVLISRVNSKVEYEADFLFVAAQNPCPCGYLLSKTKECRCNELEVERYRKRVSSPLLDRIELYVQMGEISSEDRGDISSKEMFKSVLKAFKIAIKRQGKLNSKLEEKEIDEYCRLSKDAKAILDRAIERYSLSFRSINNIKKVSRTIADLEDSKEIAKSHILEALSFRRKF